MSIKHKILSWLFAIALLATTASAAYLIFPNENQTAPNSGNPSASTSSTAITGSIVDTVATTSPVPEAKPTSMTLQPAATTTTTSADQINGLGITVDIQGEKYTLDLPASSTAYDAMLEVTKKYGVKFQFKEFAGMGFFIERIGDISNNQTTGEYWLYYINGQSATVGISQYQLKNNDLLNWKYEKAKF